MSKKALGKGIGALLKSGQETQDKNSILEVSINLLKPNPDQPRKKFTELSLMELADSIKEKGIIQPLIVESDKAGGYIIVAGERRFRAAKMAGLKTVPVITKSFNKTEKLEIALIENLQREDLTPIEEAQAYKQLMEVAQLTQEELAVHIGKNRSTIANSLRLLKLPDEIKEALHTQKISAGHARAILSLNNTQDYDKLFKRITTQGLSVREAEALALKTNKSRTGPASQDTGSEKQKDPDLLDIEQKFIDALGTKVILNGNLKKGKIQISYYSMSDLERIFDIISKK